MKKRALIMIVTSAVLLTVIAAGSKAQSRPSMLVNVPFEFTAGSTTLPAGDYRLLLDQPAHGALWVHNTRTDERAVVFPVATETRVRQDRARVVFNRYGDRFFLSQVFTPGETRGVVVPRSQEEIQLAQTSRQRETASLAGQVR